MGPSSRGRHLAAGFLLGEGAPRARLHRPGRRPTHIKNSDSVAAVELDALGHPWGFHICLHLSKFTLWAC